MPCASRQGLGRSGSAVGVAAVPGRCCFSGWWCSRSSPRWAAPCSGSSSPARPTRIAAGVRIDGVDVGGLTAGEARTKLERRASALAQCPSPSPPAATSGRCGRSASASQADWDAAVKLALDQGGGFGPFRGFRRIGVRVFGADVSPPTRVLERALDFEVGRHGEGRRPPAQRRGDRPARPAAGRRCPRAPARCSTGQAAGDTIVRALAGFQRGARRAAGPRRRTEGRAPPTSTPVAAQVRTALARPVRHAARRRLVVAADSASSPRSCSSRTTARRRSRSAAPARPATSPGSAAGSTSRPRDADLPRALPRPRRRRARAARPRRRRRARPAAASWPPRSRRRPARPASS